MCFYRWFCAVRGWLSAVVFPVIPFPFIYWTSEFFHRQVHLYNPEDTERQDGSGVNIFFTPNRRPYDAGIFLFGQWNVKVPPQETDHVISGGCSADCTSNIITDKISVTAAFNHMHYTGKVNLAINTRLKATQAQQIGSHLFRFGL